MRNFGVKLAAITAGVVMMMTVSAHAGEWKQDATGW